MLIRNLVAEDYPAVLELHTKLDEYHVEMRPDYFVHRDVVYPKEAFLHNLDYPDGMEMGAFDDEGKLVGVVRATLWNKSGMREDIKTVCLDDIYVLPEYRRSGIATQLFDAVEAWSRARGAVRLELHTWDFNKGAMAMYTARGMTPQRYVFEKKL